MKMREKVSRSRSEQWKALARDVEALAGALGEALEGAFGEALGEALEDAHAFGDSRELKSFCESLLNNHQSHPLRIKVFPLTNSLINSFVVS